jgi:hypothetical protein
MKTKSLGSSSKFGDVLVEKVAHQTHLMDLRRGSLPLTGCHNLRHVIAEREYLIRPAPTRRMNGPPDPVQLMGVVMRIGIVHDEELRVHPLGQQHERRIGGLVHHHHVGPELPMQLFHLEGGTDPPRVERAHRADNFLDEGRGRLGVFCCGHYLYVMTFVGQAPGVNVSQAPKPGRDPQDLHGRRSMPGALPTRAHLGCAEAARAQRIDRHVVDKERIADEITPPETTGFGGETVEPFKRQPA